MPLTMPMEAGGSTGARGDDAEATQVVPPGQQAQQAPRKSPHAKRCPTCNQAFSGEARFCPFDGDPLDDAPDWNPSADPLIGKVIDGRYEVISVIGEGGMGTVYEVRHATLGRRFALKILRRDIADAEHAARFIQEARAAAAIGHPNIVAVSDFGELTLDPPGSVPVPFFVMEYLSGIPLAALLRNEHQLTPERATDLVLQCAAGLAAAHAAGVIHRDLKPDNIYLARSGDREFVKLLDFGVAKMAGAGRLTRAGMVFGTPHYMSPEQAAGQHVDHRSDIYALGVILYECLAGKVPFEADTYMGVLTKHMFATPEPIDRVVADPSRLGALGPICMRCLAKDPQNRYATMADLITAIEQAMDVGPRAHRSERPRRREEETIEPPPGVRPLGKPIAIGLGGVALLALVALAVRGLASGKPSDPVPTTSASALVTATAAPPVSSTPVTPVSSATTPPSVTAPPATTPVASAPPPPTTATAIPVKSGKQPLKPPTKSGGGSGEVVNPWGH